ncbi:hypothetical protein A4A49_31154 [Nicotiana attenuata]|uniref:Putative plant transposon protein domain-containing protein n=1 Tax=Nicotiana attenuata TaxID=49451 RepID=A0A1J6JBF8_NICAT|nr:hypothetical protein A4A49_31154 [Nicotiana attenuata]
MPPRKDTCKGKASSTAQAKAKATSAPPAKKRKWGEATSSMSGAQAVAVVAAMRQQPQGQREFGINNIPPHTRDWYRRWFDPQDIEELVTIRGCLIDFSAKAICDFLGAPNVPVEPLDQFIRRPTYRELRHTLCGVDSTAAWVRDKVTNSHNRFPKKKMKAEAQRVNVGHLIRYQMASVRTSKKIDRMPFPNFLTRFLQHEGVEEEPEFDHTIDQLIQQTDITNLRLKDEAGTPSLIGVERNARDDSFMAHHYGMMDLQLRIGGCPATSEERTELEQRYPLIAHARQLVGVGDGYRLPAGEDVSIPE